jgi:hypothetical protein
LDDFVVAIYPLNYLVLALLALMCIGLPLALFFYGAGIMFLTIALSTYTIILAMLAALYPKQSRLGLSLKQYFIIAFDCIACPPFAINLVRKISWQYKLNFSPLEFAIHQLSKNDFSKFAQVLISRLDEQILFEDVNTIRSDKLQSFKSRLMVLSE